MLYFDLVFYSKDGGAVCKYSSKKYSVRETPSWYILTNIETKTFAQEFSKKEYEYKKLD